MGSAKSPRVLSQSGCGYNGALSISLISLTRSFSPSFSLLPPISILLFLSCSICSLSLSLSPIPVLYVSKLINKANSLHTHNKPARIASLWVVLCAVLLKVKYLLSIQPKNLNILPSQPSSPHLLLLFSFLPPISPFTALEVCCFFHWWITSLLTTKPVGHNQSHRDLTACFIASQND